MYLLVSRLCCERSAGSCSVSSEKRREKNNRNDATEGQSAIDCSALLQMQDMKLHIDHFTCSLSPFFCTSHVTSDWYNWPVIYLLHYVSSPAPLFIGKQGTHSWKRVSEYNWSVRRETEKCMSEKEEEEEINFHMWAPHCMIRNCALQVKNESAGEKG